tara:strand:- start:779 stop:1675 length:897 start_codon:yes stop_codon:yes gene_type:complete
VREAAAADLARLMQVRRARIDAALTDSIARVQTDTGPKTLGRALHYAVHPGGARIRPTILLSVAAACGEDCPALTDAAGVALELIHCASLVHDDLPAFDDAATRRGRPSLHRAYSEPVAVLAGDSLIVLAFETLARAGTADTALRATRLVATLARHSGMPGGICAGQGWESEAKIDLAAYHRAKTGALFIAATQMGAIAAGQPPEPWAELGSRIGEAFQIADDLRDALGDARGKPAGQDRRNGRPNAVDDLGIDGATTRLRRALDGTVASIPSCPGEAELAQAVHGFAAQIVPSQLAR